MPDAAVFQAKSGLPDAPKWGILSAYPAKGRRTSLQMDLIVEPPLGPQRRRQDQMTRRLANTHGFNIAGAPQALVEHPHFGYTHTLLLERSTSSQNKGYFPKFGPPQGNRSTSAPEEEPVVCPHTRIRTLLAGPTR